MVQVKSRTVKASAVKGISIGILLLLSAVLIISAQSANTANAAGFFLDTEIIADPETCLLSQEARGGTPFYTCAESAIVIERGRNKVYYEKNADKQLPIASTTKIVTAITVLENTADLNRTVTVPAEAVGVEGSSIYLQYDEQVRIIDLLYGLMLQSGNDCAAALAILTAGNIANFAGMMNATAVKAGAAGCNFTNPHGLHNKNHHCSARQLALITSYAMKNETFRQIVSTKVYKDCAYAGREYNRIIKNKNKMLYMSEGGNGVKTGYTKAAGRCLVSSATRDGATVIAVVLNCGPMFEESCGLIDGAFDIIFAEREELNRLIY